METKTNLVTNEVAEMVANVIVKRDGKFFVESESGKNLGGPYDTRAEAEKRLAQVEFFKNNSFSNITSNIKSEKARTRYETLEGKEYLVVPCVMMTEGVHYGSMGPLYYPQEELSKTPAIWNGKPVVVYHPQFNGQSISACDPDVFETQKIGQLFNTRWEDGKLKTECWIDEEKANQVDDRVMNAILSGQMMEVSTGLFTDNEVVEGEWNGEQFEAIARNYRPDHLAILPDQRGACSIDDGAGLLRNQAEENTPEGRLSAHYVAIVNELSHNEIWRGLSNEIGDEAWVTDVYDDFFIYEMGDKMFHQPYETKEGEVKLVGVKNEVEKIIQYQMNDGTLIGNKGSVVFENSFDKENKMKREEIVNGMISNEKSPWTEDDRELLMGLSDDKFALLSNEEEEKPEEEKPAEEKPAEEKPAEEKPADEEEEKPAENKEQSVDEFIANAPEGMRDVLRSGLDAHKAEKAKLIEKITANKKNPFSKEQLQAKGLSELKQLATLAEVEPEKPKQPVAPPAFFGGQAEVVAPAVNDSAEEPLQAPTMNFGSEE